MALTNAGHFISNAVNSLEKSMEFKYFMIFSAFVLSLDNALLFFFDKNIFTALKRLDDPEVSIGNALVFLALLYYLMSLFLPAIRRILQLLVSLADIKWGLFNKERSEHFRFLSQLKSHAIEHKDSFLLGYCNDIEVQRKDFTLVQNVCFSVAVLLAINFFIHDSSLSSMIYSYTPSTSFGVTRLIAIFYSVFLITVGAMAITGLAPEDDRVYYPYKLKKDDNKDT